MPHKMVNGKSVPLTRADIKSREDRELRHAAELAELDRTEYKRLRKAEYGSWEDQFDMMYHNHDGWVAHVATIKAKYPKP